MSAVPDYRITSTADGSAWKIYQYDGMGCWTPIHRPTNQAGSDRFATRAEAEAFVSRLRNQLHYERKQQ